MLLGVDIGYNSTKVLSGKNPQIFSSFGLKIKPDGFSFNTKSNKNHLTVDGVNWLIGDVAVDWDTGQTRLDDRHWTESPLYRALFAGSLAKSVKGRATVNAVTGLPFAYFQGDKVGLENTLKGSYSVELGGEKSRTVKVEEVIVMPQGFGVFIDYKVNVQSINNAVIIDLGSRTTNILTVRKNSLIPTKSTTLNKGAWDIVSKLRSSVAVDHPGFFDLTDHDIDRYIRQGYFSVEGSEVTLNRWLEPIKNDFITDMIQEVSNLRSSKLEKNILVAGGGAYMIGNTLKARSKSVKVLPSPEFSNVRGYLAYADLIWSK